MRKSDIFLLFLLCNILIGCLFSIHAGHQTKATLLGLQQLAGIVENLKLTDLCLATEAAYTRHPSQSDWHTPFQSHPLALEHFPTGSIIRPPAFMR